MAPDGTIIDRTKLTKPSIQNITINKMIETLSRSLRIKHYSLQYKGPFNIMNYKERGCLVKK